MRCGLLVGCGWKGGGWGTEAGWATLGIGELRSGMLIPCHFPFLYLIWQSHLQSPRTQSPYDISDIAFYVPPYPKTVTFDPSSIGQLALVMYEWNDVKYLGADTPYDDELPVSLHSSTIPHHILHPPSNHKSQC